MRITAMQKSTDQSPTWQTPNHRYGAIQPKKARHTAQKNPANPQIRHPAPMEGVAPAIPQKRDQLQALKSQIRPGQARKSSRLLPAMRRKKMCQEKMCQAKMHQEKMLDQINPVPRKTTITSRNGVTGQAKLAAQPTQASTRSSLQDYSQH